MIDAGIIFGTGFAPFHGGPLQYVKDRGQDEVVMALENLEKVHGSNLSIHCDGKEVKFARRKDFIEEGENFYNHQTIKETLEEKMWALWNAWKDVKKPNSLVIYGEIIGSGYPEMKSAHKRIQKGVYYSPNIEFYVFDIKIDGKYCDYVAFEAYCQYAGFFITR